jgi:hypothetical protein
MTPRQFDELIDEIIDERNDRSLIILCSSIIDEQLYTILEKYLLKTDKIKDDDILKGDNPLSTFSSRIKIIYRLGLIDKTFREVLDQIRKVRNECAHRVSINIDKSPIKDHLKNIKVEIIQRQSFKLCIDRYFEGDINKKNELKALFTTICIILKAINDSLEKVSENQVTINISKK